MAWEAAVLRCPSFRTARVQDIDIVVRPYWPTVSKIPSLTEVAAACLRDFHIDNVRVVETEDHKFLLDYPAEDRNFLPDRVHSLLPDCPVADRNLHRDCQARSYLPDCRVDIALLVVVEEVDVRCARCWFLRFLRATKILPTLPFRLDQCIQHQMLYLLP